MAASRLTSMNGMRHPLPSSAHRMSLCWWNSLGRAPGHQKEEQPIASWRKNCMRQEVRACGCLALPSVPLVESENGLCQAQSLETAASEYPVRLGSAAIQKLLELEVGHLRHSWAFWVVQNEMVGCKRLRWEVYYVSCLTSSTFQVMSLAARPRSCHALAAQSDDFSMRAWLVGTCKLNWN